MKRVNTQNRAAKAYAQSVFEGLYNDRKTRLACAQILADSILTAHEISPACWSLTLFEKKVRLNVGPVEVVVLRSDEIFMIFSAAEKRQFTNKELEPYMSARGLHYPSVPVDQRTCFIPPDQITKLYGLIATRQQDFVSEAANCRKTTTWKYSFSPGVIYYLNELLDIELPMPSYYDDRQTLTVLQEIEQFKNSYENLPPTTRQAVIESRIGQGKFRRELIEYWDGCSVTGCKVIEVLKASHIKPWQASNNAERLDPYNGLLLLPSLDACFDLGFISFADDGQILISDKLSKATLKELGVNPDMKLLRVEQKHKGFLHHHRKVHGFIL